MNFSLINSECWRNCLAFGLIQGLVDDGSVLQRNFAGVDVDVRQCVLPPVLLNGYGLLTLKRLCVVELIDSDLEYGNISESNET